MNAIEVPARRKVTKLNSNSRVLEKSANNKEAIIGTDKKNPRKRVSSQINVDLFGLQAVNKQSAFKRKEKGPNSSSPPDEDTG